MSHPWRTPLVATTWTLLGHPRRGLESIGLRRFARAESELGIISKERAGGATSSIIIGAISCFFLVSLAVLGTFYFFKRTRQRSADVESSGVSEKSRNWWMVDCKDEKCGVLQWWRQSHSIPDRIEPPASSTPQRSSLQRLKSALTRKGMLNSGHVKKDSHVPFIPNVMGKTSPAATIDLPLQTVPQIQPRYPSVLERSYRVPLYPVQSPPKAPSPPRSLTTPIFPPVTLPAPPAPASQPLQPRAIVAERAVRRNIAPIPRALKLHNGRPLAHVPFSDRKLGSPRSPAHRRRNGFFNQLKHPFLPLKDSDTAFPTISSPMPCTETSLTNPKLGYGDGMSNTVVPGGARQLSRASTRRVPVPAYESKPARPLLPAVPLHLKEDVQVYPPGLAPSVRQTPAPI